jgi:hypothetical protein
MNYLQCLSMDSVEEWLLSPRGEPFNDVDIVDLLLRIREEYTRWSSLYGRGLDDGVGTLEPLVPPTRIQWEGLLSQQQILKKFLPPEISASLHF